MASLLVRLLVKDGRIDVNQPLEPYSKVEGLWYYPYRPVDKAVQIIDFPLTAQRAEQVVTGARA